MSGGHAFTPTRELASAAAETASRAYATARETSAKFSRMEEEIASLRAELVALRSSLTAPPAPPPPAPLKIERLVEMAKKPGMKKKPMPAGKPGGKAPSGDWYPQGKLGGGTVALKANPRAAK